MKETICIDFGNYKTTAVLSFMESNSNKHIKLNILDPHNLQNTYMNSKFNGQVIASKIKLTYEQLEKLQWQINPDYDLLCSLGDISIGDTIENTEESIVFSYFKQSPDDFDVLYSDFLNVNDPIVKKIWHYEWNNYVMFYICCCSKYF